MTVNPNTGRANTRLDAAPESRTAERFVLVAQTLVILAFAAGLSVQAGLHPVISGSAVLAVVLTLYAINKVIAARKAQRSRATSSRSSTAPNMAQASNTHVPAQSHPAREDAGAPVIAAPTPAPTTGHPVTGLQVWPDEAGYADVGLDQPQPRAFDPGFGASPSFPAPTVGRSPAPELPRVMPRYSGAPQGRSQPLQTSQNHYAPAPADIAPPYAYGGGSHELWAQRHAPTPNHDLAALSYQNSQPEGSVQPREMPSPLREEAVGPLRETDVEAIQSLIKKLADEVNSAESQRGDSIASPNTEAGGQFINDGARAGVSEPGPTSAESFETGRTFEPERAVEQSLDALRVTAETMRQPSHLVFGHELPPPIPAPPGKATLLAQAISAGRVDVLLEPILGLQSQEAQHFEVSLRLRAEDGSALALNQLDRELRGTGLLPLFDAAKMTRTASVARRLAERGKTGAVFSSYSGEALTDQAFRNDAAAASGQRAPGSGQLVLTFSQSDARAFQAPEWDAIASMRAMGFRFALSDVTDLDMDIEALVRAGFDFVKLDAEVFLCGLRSPAGLIPSADVCRYLAGLGLALVVERIDNEDMFARVFGFGALFGQGQLFGGARVLKPEASGGAQAAA